MRNQNFTRKLVYIATIAILLIPLYRLGQPSSKKANGDIVGGGELAKLRNRYNIGQADLGQIDPASESMRLATLGMRGIAAAYLWQKADYYKEEKFYDRLAATLNQISLLQPHFIKVWESQAHNLSYNVSHDFDDYRQRYAWIKKGLDYLVRGTRFNERQPILQWHLGKFTCQKLGRADEKVQFRELFRNDDDYHQSLIADGLTDLNSEALGPDRKPDNWLAGRLWFMKAYDLVASGAILNKNEVHFYAEAPWARLYYGEAIESEGVLDDRARFAWSRAHDAWQAFGSRDILTTFGDLVQLQSLQRNRTVVQEQIETFNALTKNEQAKLLAESTDAMNDDERYIVGKDRADMTAEEKDFDIRTRQKFLNNRFEIARLLPTEQRGEGLSLATSIRSLEERIDHTEQYRDLCNYSYWDMRSEAEQSTVTLAARKQLYDADNLIGQADLSGATKRYEKAWLNWNAVFHRYPEMMTEEIADSVLEAVNRYMSATDSNYGDDFALNDFLTYRRVRDGNRMDEENAQRYQIMLDAAPTWEAAMNTPALLDNDVVPRSTVDPKPAKIEKTTRLKEESPNAIDAETSADDIPARPPTLEPSN